MRATHAPGGEFNFTFDGFYGTDEWHQGFNALPTGSAVLDLTVTDRILHARLYRGENTDYDRWEINRFLQERHAGQWLSPEGSVLEPRFDKREQRHAAVDAALPEVHHSYNKISWLRHYRVMRIYWDDARRVSVAVRMVARNPLPRKRLARNL